MFRAAAFALCLASGTAWTDPQFGPYVEAGAGRTYFDLKKAGLDHWSQVPAASSSLDRGDAGYSLATGFRFSPFLAIELAYLDLGKTRYLVEDNGAAARLNLGSKGPALSLIGSWRINKTFSLEGRGGLYFSDVDFGTTLIVGTVAALGIFEGESGGGDPGWLLGAGAIASLGGHWSIRAGYDYFDGKAAGLRHPVLGTELDSRAGRWGLGLRYTF
jgi:opacity protein-like surface antigen